MSLNYFSVEVKYIELEKFSIVLQELKCSH